MTDEDQIRALVERWAEAVHAGDLAAVLADHADDIVMFDVPPPYEGVRGIDAYRETWPGFFEWQAWARRSRSIAGRHGRRRRRVRVRAAALRHGGGPCGEPGQRLRLTLGLRKEDGRWVVAHEHHSFPDESPLESAEIGLRP